MTKTADHRYSVSFRGGTCGHFIAMLLLYSLSDRTDDIVFESTGGAHTPFIKWISENVENEFEGEPLFKVLDIYRSSKLKDTSPYNFLIQPIPFIIPDLNELYQVNPNFKHIIITCDSQDLLKAEINYFYKRLSPVLWNSEFNEVYDILKNTYSIQNKNANNLLELSPTEIKAILSYNSNREYIMRRGVFTRYTSSECPFVDDHYVVPDQFKDHVTLINFRDILENKQLILEKISTITGKATTSDLERQYNNYLALQAQLDSKIPL